MLSNHTFDWNHPLILLLFSGTKAHCQSSPSLDGKVPWRPFVHLTQKVLFMFDSPKRYPQPWFINGPQYNPDLSRRRRVDVYCVLSKRTTPYSRQQTTISTLLSSSINWANCLALWLFCCNKNIIISFKSYFSYLCPNARALPLLSHPTLQCNSLSSAFFICPG